MKRLFVLLIPIAVIAAGGPAAKSDADPAAAAKHWSDSLQAETDKKYAAALEAVASYQNDGGDAFLSAERIGWLNYLAGDYEKADKAYGNASRMVPMALNPLLGLLNTAQALKDPRKTERVAELILKEDASNYRALMALGGLHFAEKDYVKAAATYKKALMHFPDDTDAMSGAAWTSFYLGEKREAQDVFRRILTIFPTYPLAQRGYDLCTGKIDK